MTTSEAPRDQPRPPAAPPGTPENPLRLDNPRMMRALAHPARIAILQHLGLDGPATATECAAVVGLSPSACSYHLRALARYGFVEEDPASAADGRQRPWRVRIISMSFDEGEPGQPEALRAAGRLLTESLLARFEEMRAEYLGRADRYSAEWRDVAGWNQDVLHVTVAEATALRDQIRALLASYRRLDPADRPPDAHRVHTLLRSAALVRPRRAAMTDHRPARGRAGAAGRCPAGASGCWPAGQFTSTVGDYCYAVALPWLVLSTHGGAILLGTVLACYGLPRTALIPVGGLLADKIGARTIMLAADAARCGLVIALVVLAAGHVASLALLGPVAALLGAGEGLFIPASFSVMPSLLEPEHLAAGNAINSAAVQAGSVAGPVLGGLLVAAAGPTPAFAVDAASFAISALSLALVRLAAVRPRGGDHRPGHAGAAGQGRPPATPAHVPRTACGHCCASHACSRSSSSL